MVRASRRAPRAAEAPGAMSPRDGFDTLHEKARGDDLLLGKRLNDRYLLQEKLGQGGMGAVYLAIDSESAGPTKLVAVKVLTYQSEDGAGAERASKRFRQEAMALLSINHPNVIKVSDARTHGNLRYFVMEYLKGVSLRDEMRRNLRYSWSRTKEMGLQLAKGLKAAHERGIIHRDLKPDNIFIDESQGGKALKILDFGVAKIVDEDLKGTTLTIAGSTIGTPTHMAPEQAEGRADIDHRADIYSFGIIMYQLLTGKLPFTAQKVREIMLKQLNETPVLPSRKAPEYGIPHEADEFIMRLLEKEREKRFQSMDDIIEVLSSDRSIEDPSRGRLALRSEEDLAGKVERVLSQTRTQRTGNWSMKRMVVGLMSFGAVASGGALAAHQMGYMESAPSVVERIREEMGAAGSGKAQGDARAKERFDLTLMVGLEGAQVLLVPVDAQGGRGQESLLGTTGADGSMTSTLDTGLFEIRIRKDGYQEERLPMHVIESEPIRMESPLKKSRKGKGRR